MQFADPYLTDMEAQRTLTYAYNRAKHADLKASFIYRLGGAGQVIDIWRIIRPDEIIAEAETAKKASKYVPPDYVRYQDEDGVRVAHYVRRQLPHGHQTPPTRAASGIEVGSETLGHSEPPGARRRESPPPPKPTPPPQPLLPSVESLPMETSIADGADSSDEDEEEWIWTGTDLVRNPHEDNEDNQEPPES